MAAGVLLLLPCNPGAKEGNYFPYGAWKQALASLRKHHVEKQDVDFAAVDSIITVLDPARDRDAKGAIVHESEMHRVRGCDVKPTWNRFEGNNHALLHEHARYCKIGLQRFLPGYNLVVVALSVRAYKYAGARALIDTGGGNLPPNVIFIDAGESPSYQNNAINIASLFINDYLIKRENAGFFITPRALSEPNRFLARPANLPTEYRFWETGTWKIA